MYLYASSYHWYFFPGTTALFGSANSARWNTLQTSLQNLTKTVLTLQHFTMPECSRLCLSPRFVQVHALLKSTLCSSPRIWVDHWSCTPLVMQTAHRPFWNSKRVLVRSCSPSTLAFVFGLRLALSLLFSFAFLFLHCDLARSSLESRTISLCETAPGIRRSHVPLLGPTPRSKTND